MSRRVLIIGYRDHPSTRLRILAYVPDLERHGFTVEVSLLDQGASSAHRQKQIAALERQIARADAVFVQRVLDGQLNSSLRHARKPVLFDLDDALHHVRPERHSTASPRGILESQLKRTYRRFVRGGPYVSSGRRSLYEICRIAHTVIVGNRWLYNEFAGVARSIALVPTTVPVRGRTATAADNSSRVNIGWIGLRDNFRSLRLLDEPLAALAERHPADVRLVVVSNEPYETEAIDTQFVEWSLQREQAVVPRFDIGVMPLEDHPFNLGKCAFKAILCMSYGVPVVASPVGANPSVIDHGRNGFLARDTEQWVECLSALSTDPGLRQSLGSAALDTIRARFSAADASRQVMTVIDHAIGP